MAKVGQVNVLLVLAVFVAMEGFTYCAHRWMMHGFAWVLHKSHHRTMAERFEANDLFPVIFASITMLLMATAGDWKPMFSVVVGISAYGLAYMFVHDVYIHGRLPLPRRPFRCLEPLREAHRIHHLYNGEPYGMLIPLVPERLRRRAALTERDPLTARTAATVSTRPSR